MSRTTSRAAEFAAWSVAVVYIAEAKLPQMWAVLCYFKASIQSLQSVLRRRMHKQLVNEAREVLHEALSSGYDVVLLRLPGHRGIVSNDPADVAAPRPLTRTPGLPQYPHRKQTLQEAVTHSLTQCRKHR
uniref:Uncharacterized protein n=1 Tax=Rhipicephalus zambeziensis TaxID=60191 RepID=A0A224Z261_9ACAR